ncbi:protein BONZAI 2-like [Raphanus sativus]|nr:protein BONZAI 2-like [Raphanus sativus]
MESKTSDRSSTWKKKTQTWKLLVRWLSSWRNGRPRREHFLLLLLLRRAVDHYLKSHGFDGLFSQIELSFSASNLRDRDVTSKSDAMVVVYTKGRDGTTLAESFRREVVLNSLNPRWITSSRLVISSRLCRLCCFASMTLILSFKNQRRRFKSGLVECFENSETG